MGLKIGIVGLPNVGKSTTFNALTGAQNAEVANYPFCTIEPNRAIVPVPDARLENLHRLLGVPEKIHATIEFVDIAGLVKGAHKGEGLGNKFLGHIRDVHAILHVVRCFDDLNVIHSSETIDPVSDIGVINVELALADLEQLERKIEKLISQVKGDRRAQPTLDLAYQLREYLQEGRVLSIYPEQDDPVFKDLVQEMRFLTAKSVIYAANVDETGLGDQNAYVQAVRGIAAQQGAEVVLLCARLEEEMLSMTPEDRAEFFELAGVTESGLTQLIHKGFAALGLISFFTRNQKEVRAWEIHQGSTAPQAAGAIHTDFERGFIRAEVIPYETYTQYGSDAAAKAHGAMRIEGKEYIVHDGDIIYFRFNV